MQNAPSNMYVSFATLGGLLMLVYHVVTNIVWGYGYGPRIVVAMVFGVPFSFLHVASNVIFFGLGCIPAINAVSKVGVDNLLS